MRFFLFTCLNLNLKVTSWQDSTWSSWCHFSSNAVCLSVCPVGSRRDDVINNALTVLPSLLCGGCLDVDTLTWRSWSWVQITFCLLPNLLKLFLCKVQDDVFDYVRGKWKSIKDSEEKKNQQICHLKIKCLFLFIIIVHFKQSLGCVGSKYTLRFATSHCFLLAKSLCQCQK